MMRLAVCLYLCVLVSVSLRAQQPAAPPQPSNALPAVRTGAQIYGAACATCHARDGRGAPTSVKDWPLGDLNFPRAFFTEKAFPGNEAVWETNIATEGAQAVGNELIYERRFGARNQIEMWRPRAAYPA